MTIASDARLLKGIAPSLENLAKKLNATYISHYYDFDNAKVYVMSNGLRYKVTKLNTWIEVDW